ncbi:MAG: halogenase, partial [Planctomycetota bacterium]
RFQALTMPYFAAATTYEQRRSESAVPPAFLCADDPALRRAVWSATTDVLDAPPGTDPVELLRRAGRALAAFNRVGLCDPAAGNLYRYTAAAK